MEQGASMRGCYRVGHVLVRVDTDMVARGRATDLGNRMAHREIIKRPALQRYVIENIFRNHEDAEWLRKYFDSERQKTCFVKFESLVQDLTGHWPADKDFSLFSLGGLGIGRTPGCFVHGGEEKLYNDLSGFVQTEEIGEKFVGLFQGKGASLDCRENEPHLIQVKIGACDKHLPNLYYLYYLSQSFATLNKEMIDMARRRRG